MKIRQALGTGIGIGIGSFIYRGVKFKDWGFAAKEGVAIGACAIPIALVLYAIF